MGRGVIQTARLPDFLTCISVIEHGVAPNAFVKQCARLLKPGGMIFDRHHVAAFLERCEAHGLTPLNGASTFRGAGNASSIIWDIPLHFSLWYCGVSVRAYVVGECSRRRPFNRPEPR